MRRVERARMLGLGLLLWVGAGIAQESAEGLRPTGPVKISADRAQWEKGGAMVYTGKVRMESGDLKLQGERLTLRQSDDGQFEAVVEGSPATLDHAGVAVESQGERVPVSARGGRLVYDSRSDLVEFEGDALLTRGTDEIRGNRIRYDVARRRIEAAGGDEGQVQIVIQPPPRKAAPGAPKGATP